MVAVAIAKERTPAELRALARRERDGRVSWRLLALANALDGMSRDEAARAAGMDRQTLRDWVHRYNAEGLAGLRDRPRSGRKPRLTAGQEAELATAVERGPDPDRDGVVRWRRVDLQALIEARFAVRPRHPKADEAAQAAFKKASPSWWRERCPGTPAASRSRSGSRMRPA